MKQHDSVQHLQQMMIDGGEKAFDVVPTILRNVLEKRLWEKRSNKQGQRFSSFESFVADPLWYGLESSIEELRLYCRKHPETDKLIMAEVGAIAEHGGDRNQGSGATLIASRGATYALRRLKRDRPDLAQKVIDGEISAHAAAIEAGFRKKRHCPKCGHEW